MVRVLRAKYVEQLLLKWLLLNQNTYIDFLQRHIHKKTTELQELVECMNRVFYLRQDMYTDPDILQRIESQAQFFRDYNFSTLLTKYIRMCLKFYDEYKTKQSKISVLLTTAAERDANDGKSSTTGKKSYYENEAVVKKEHAEDAQTTPQQHDEFSFTSNTNPEHKAVVQQKHEVDSEKEHDMKKADDAKGTSNEDFVQGQHKTPNPDIKDTLERVFNLSKTFIKTKLAYETLNIVLDHLVKIEKEEKIILTPDQIVERFNQNPDTQKLLTEKAQNSTSATGKQSQEKPEQMKALRTFNATEKKPESKPKVGWLNQDQQALRQRERELTNLKQSEFKLFLDDNDFKNNIVMDVKGDGDCLFTCLAFIANLQEFSKILKKKWNGSNMRAFMIKKEEEFAQKYTTRCFVY